MSSVEGYSTTSYCTVSDVESYLNIETSFSSSTDPTDTEVSGMCLDWSDYIDRETGHAWRERRVSEEFHALHETPYYFGSGTPLPLQRRQIVTPLDSAEGDKLEVWNGNSYDDWVADSSKSEGRGDGSYWVDESTGILYIFRRWTVWSRPSIKVTYRYGNQDIPRDIKKACTKLVAADVVTSDWYAANIPGTDAAMSQSEVVEKWREDAERVIKNRKEVRSIPSW